MSIPESNPQLKGINTFTPKIKRLAKALREPGEQADSARKELLTILASSGNLELAEIIDLLLTDHRTFLGNTMSLEQDIDAVLSSDDSSQALFITTDLVGFKQFNDIYGQEIGDEILKISASALRSAIRFHPRPYSDSVYARFDDQYDSSGYRIGGDEFAALLRDGEKIKTADHEALLRSKLIHMLGNLALHDYLTELKNNRIEETRPQFGIRGACVLLDNKVHHSYSDVLKCADPKLDKICEYVLNHLPNNEYIIEKIK